MKNLLLFMWLWISWIPVQSPIGAAMPKIGTLYPVGAYVCGYGLRSFSREWGFKFPLLCISLPTSIGLLGFQWCKTKEKGGTEVAKMENRIWCILLPPYISSFAILAPVTHPSRTPPGFSSVLSVPSNFLYYDGCRTANNMSRKALNLAEVCC